VAIPQALTEDTPRAAGPAEPGPAGLPNWLTALRAPKIAAGLSIVLFFIGVAIFGPMIDRTDPNALSRALLQGPSAAHWLGTTQTGQDIFAQLINGARISLFVGFVAGAIATAASLFIGLLGGYLGGVPDEILSVFSNIFLVIPALPLVIIMAGYLPGKGALSVAVVISVTGWAWGARSSAPRRFPSASATTSRRRGSRVREPCGSSSSRSCPTSWPSSRRTSCSRSSSRS
jgi:peptide/nickel transport system permease protein